MFAIHSIPEKIKLKSQRSPAILDLCLRKTRAAKSRDYRDVIVLEKLHMQNIQFTWKRDWAAFLNSFAVWKAFSKAPFLWRIRVDDRPNRGNKATFSNFSGVLWGMPQVRKLPQHLHIAIKTSLVDVSSEIIKTFIIQLTKVLSLLHSSMRSVQPMS